MNGCGVIYNSPFRFFEGVFQKLPLLNERHTMTSLNPDQLKAANAFLDFMLSDDIYAVITGPAGVGKTFLMEHLSNNGMKMYADACTLIQEEPKYTETHFTATTNKAAGVLGTSIGKPVSTIHSFLGLKIQRNFDTGKAFLTKSRNFHIREGVVVFIDEASTIDTDLMKFLDIGLPNCKIVFVGDHAQMAPVNEDISPAFLIGKPENCYTLTTPVRNADTPALMALCQQLRDTVETGIFKPIVAVPGVIEYLTPDHMEEGLGYVFEDPDPSCRVLCFTNDRVKDYNAHIREDVRSLPAHLTVGEAVVVGDSYQRGQLTFSVEQQLTITSVGPDLPTGYEYEGEPVMARDVGFGDADPDAPFFGAPVCTNPHVLKSALAVVKRRKDWRTFYEMKDRFLDIRDKASCTVYKSQGSSYDFVFVDLGNIGTSFDAQQVARMIYVAVSRARHKVFFYGELPNRYNDSKGAQLWIPKNGPNSSQENSSNTTEAA